METLIFDSILVGAVALVSFLYGLATQKKKQYKNDLQTGEKIDKIISDNSSISDSDWNKWLQERGNKQK